MQVLPQNKLAILGGDRIRTKQFSEWPAYTPEQYYNAFELLKDYKSLFRGVNIPNIWQGKPSNNITEKFECKLAALFEVQYLFAVNSGSTALELALDAFQFEKDSEVIVTPYTYFASAASIVKNNLKPIFADIELHTLNMDAKCIEALITPKTKAILIVHFGGIPVNMEAIYKITKKQGIKIIEDCCHTITAEYDNKRCGNLGDISCFSFQDSKLLTAGEGGAVATNIEKYALRMFSMHNGGRPSSKGISKYNHVLLGGNYRISEIQSALLYIGLNDIFIHRKKREINISYFKSMLKAVQGLSMIDVDNEKIKRDYYIIALRFDTQEFNGLTIKKFVLALNAEGIPCSTGYPKGLYEYSILLKDDPYAQNYKKMCINTEIACKEIVWLDQRLFLGSKNDIDDIINAIDKVKKYAGQITKTKK